MLNLFKEAAASVRRLTHNNPTPYLAREVTTFHACRAEANLALCDQVLLGSGVIAAARVYTCRAHRRFIAHLRGQHHPRPAPILDWLRHISRKGLGHHCRPCRRLSRSHQAERTHRRHGPARECHQGSLSLERVDLTLLSIDERKLPIYLQMRRLSLCENQPWPGEPVIVAVPEGTARSHVMLPALLPANVQKKFSTVISDVATTGNSGSGLFDAGQKCLLGIMSRKITVRPNTATGKAEEKDIAKYFVPASTIRAFIPTEYRF